MYTNDGVHSHVMVHGQLYCELLIVSF